MVFSHITQGVTAHPVGEGNFIKFEIDNLNMKTKHFEMLQ